MLYYTAAIRSSRPMSRAVSMLWPREPLPPVTSNQPSQVAENWISLHMQIRRRSTSHLDHPIESPFTCTCPTAIKQKSREQNTTIARCVCVCVCMCGVVEGEVGRRGGSGQSRSSPFKAPT